MQSAYHPRDAVMCVHVHDDSVQVKVDAAAPLPSLSCQFPVHKYGHQITTLFLDKCDEGQKTTPRRIAPPRPVKRVPLVVRSPRARAPID